MEMHQSQAENGEFSHHLEVSDRTLAHTLEVGEVRIGWSGDLMQAQLDLVNKGRGSLSLEYRLRWTDAQGMLIDAEAQSWKPLTLLGYERKALGGVAPNPTAEEFVVMVKRAK
jgi:uncharacterized protein YcfL